MSNKKSSKKEEEMLAEIAKHEQDARREEEERIKVKKHEELAIKSEPLLDYGLIDAYQHFLLQLAHHGIPQTNVYQFAAQAIIRFAKHKQKNQMHLKQIEKVNQNAIKSMSQVSPTKQKGVKTIKPQMLPFKGQITEKDMEVLNKL